MTLTGHILITGGSGTLGNAIVRTAEREGWDATFTIYSRSESRQAAMRSRHPRLRYVLGDVRDAERVNAVIPGHDAVIHAAAMKRIPECEAQPSECIKTNVVGTHTVECRGLDRLCHPALAAAGRARRGADHHGPAMHALLYGAQ
jgi:UDP-N-acetylglucosamine 4,6-dehydratase